MANLQGVIQQLKQERDRLARQIEGISAAIAAFGSAFGKGTRRGKISAAGRARIAAAQRARWAKVRGKAPKKNNVIKMPKRRTMSPAARKKIASAQRARWARVRAKKTA